jgi:tetratricopeptide (TPR) repeat protein
LKEKGNAAFKEGRWDEALTLFSAAIELDPSNHVFFANRSAASINLKQYTRALHDARTSLKNPVVKGKGSEKERRSLSILLTSLFLLGKAIELKPDWPRVSFHFFPLKRLTLL